MWAYDIIQTMSSYRLAPPAPENPAYEKLINQLLFNRGLKDPELIKFFLDPDYEKRHDPFLLHDMDKAVARILKAIEKKEKIVIFSDYDCDGIPGAVVLHDFFKAIDHKNFSNYIPHRHFEGFGLNKKAIEKFKDEETDLIITIDCGTGDHGVIKEAVDRGMDVIVTDHHEPKNSLPEAVAVVNPKVGDSYPFGGLCGAGVVFKLIEALIAKGGFDIKPGQEKWWLDMVGLATINDMVPLVDENRIFAHYGLKVLRKSRRPGLQHLLNKARANQRYLTEDDVGFTIGPRINAASRMDTPEDAFFMLATEDEEEAGARVEHLEKLNNERKGLVASISKELKKRLSEMSEVPDVLVLGNPSWRPALVGLAANKLADEYNRPAFLWGKDGNGVIKGSCRSGGQISVVKLMEATAEDFIEHGGHHFSGGFSVKDEAIFGLPERLNQAYKSLGESAKADEEILIDAELYLSDVNEELIRSLRSLAPYGVGNPKPLFRFKGVTPSSVAQFGKTKEHLKLNFNRDFDILEAIAFFSTPEIYQRTPKVNEELTLLAHVEDSFFMGRRQTRLRIVDII